MLVIGLSVICDNYCLKVFIWNTVDGHHKGKHRDLGIGSVPGPQRPRTVMVPILIKRKSKVTL